MIEPPKPRPKFSYVGRERFGEARGIKLGEARGEAKTLLKLLKLKFGTVPEGIEEKVNSADKVQLDYWVERILTAESMDSLLANTNVNSNE